MELGKFFIVLFLPSAGYFPYLMSRHNLAWRMVSGEDCLNKLMESFKQHLWIESRMGILSGLLGEY